MTPTLDAVRREELRKAEIDYSGFSVDQLRHYLRIRDRQAMTSRAYWLRAAKKALDGDSRELANRVDLAEMGPVTITNGDTEGTFNAVPGAELADDIDALLTRIAELEAGPKVRSLLWCEQQVGRGDKFSDPTGDWSADTMIGEYTVTFDPDEDVKNTPWCAWTPLESIGHFGEINEAKAAAQADYESRILAALLPKASVREERK